MTLYFEGDLNWDTDFLPVDVEDEKVRTMKTER